MEASLKAVISYLRRLIVVGLGVGVGGEIDMKEIINSFMYLILFHMLQQPIYNLKDTK